MQHAQHFAVNRVDGRVSRRAKSLDGDLRSFPTTAPSANVRHSATTIELNPSLLRPSVIRTRYQPKCLGMVQIVVRRVMMTQAVNGRP